jgi:hypothetical protein
MALAIKPITGVATAIPSRMTDVTGIIMPQHNPTVNTAMMALSKGRFLKFIHIPLMISCLVKHDCFQAIISQ